jgi:hypothetical protein
MNKSEALLLELFEQHAVWNVTQCGLRDGSSVYGNLLTYLILKIGAAHLSVMLVPIYRTTWNCVAECSTPCHHCENLKTNNVILFLVNQFTGLWWSSGQDHLFNLIIFIPCILSVFVYTNKCIYFCLKYYKFFVHVRLPTCFSKCLSSSRRQ